MPQPVNYQGRREDVAARAAQLGGNKPRALVTLADKGYQGSSYAKVPYRGKNKPESQKQANKAHTKLRLPGERANAQLKTRSRPAQDLAHPPQAPLLAPGAPDNSPRPPAYCRSAKHKTGWKAFSHPALDCPTVGHPPR